MGDTVILTGGAEVDKPTSRVSVYNVTGFINNMEPLNRARHRHACSYYDNDDNTKVDETSLDSAMTSSVSDSIDLI